MVKILYLPSEIEKMLRPVVGDGGVQRLFRRIQNGLVRLDTGQWELTVTVSDIERCIVFVEANGPGGFQDRARPMLPAMKRALAGMSLPKVTAGVLALDVDEER